MQRIKELRKEKSMNQIALGMELNFSQKIISDKIAQSKLSETECELLNEFRCLPKEKQNIALGIIMGLKHS